MTPEAARMALDTLDAIDEAEKPASQKSMAESWMAKTRARGLVARLRATCNAVIDGEGPNLFGSGPR